MGSKIDAKRAKDTMYRTMSQTNEIGRMVTEKNFVKAHDLRDRLFSYVIRELTVDVDKYTKRDMEEILNVLRGVDDWGI